MSASRKETQLWISLHTGNLTGLFTCMTATQVSRRLLETNHELVCSQMASLYDSVIEFSCQLEILNWSGLRPFCDEYKSAHCISGTWIRVKPLSVPESTSPAHYGTVVVAGLRYRTPKYSLHIIFAWTEVVSFLYSRKFVSVSYLHRIGEMMIQRMCQDVSCRSYP